MFSAVVGADLHLNLSMWNTNKAIRFDSLFSFYSLLDIASQTKRALILAGDTFDTKHISSELFLYTRALRDAYADVPIYYVNGNHDSNDPSWLAMLQNTHRLTNQGTNIDGIDICGMDYVLADDFEDALREVYPYAQILITHQTYDCFFNSPTAIDHTLLRNRGLVLSGDYHTPGEHILQPEDENSKITSIVSIGAATKCSVAEGTGSALKVYADEYGITFNRWKLPSRVFLDVSDLIKKGIQPVDLTTCIPPSPRPRGSLDYLGVSYSKFIDILTEAARSMSRPRPIYTTTLAPVFVARTKDELDYANEAVKEVKYGFILYSPVVTPSVELEDSEVVPQSRDTISTYLKQVAQSYPCDNKVKSALIDFISSDTPAFIEAEAKRFGMEDA